MWNNIIFSNDMNGYYFQYKQSNISQYVAKLIGISTRKLHNIVRKHNGKILHDHNKYSASSFYRFDTIEECKRAAEELEQFILMKQLIE